MIYTNNTDKILFYTINGNPVTWKPKEEKELNETIFSTSNRLKYALQNKIIVPVNKKTFTKEIKKEEFKVIEKKEEIKHYEKDKEDKKIDKI